MCCSNTSAINPELTSGFRTTRYCWTSKSWNQLPFKTNDSEATKQLVSSGSSSFFTTSSPILISVFNHFGVDKAQG